MKADILQEMLLINEPSAISLYKEFMRIASLYIAPVFMIALILEYFGEMNFGEVIKKLFIAVIAISIFYQIHTEGVKVAFEGATEVIQKVNPSNLFMKKWYYSKMATKESGSWNFLEAFAIPNLNDLVATAFFVISKIFIWILKLIYSSVYHLTYIFAPISALLYLFGWTNNSLKGSVQASIWCMLMPFVVVAVLVLVGNSMSQSANNSELIVAHIDTIVWLFGITLLLLLTPIITFSLVRGEGVHALGTKMGITMVGAGLKAGMVLSSIKGMKETASKGFSSIQNTVSKFRDKNASQTSQNLKESKLKDTNLSNLRDEKSSRIEKRSDSKNSHFEKDQRQNTNQTNLKNDRQRESHSLSDRNRSEKTFENSKQKDQMKLDQNQTVIKGKDSPSYEKRIEEKNSSIKKDSSHLQSTWEKKNTTHQVKTQQNFIRKERPNDLRRI